MKIGKDQVLCIQKYTEKYRSTVKTGLIFTTVSQIAEKNSSQEQKDTKNQGNNWGNFVKFPQAPISQSTINTGEDTTVENHPKKRRFFFGGMFDEVEILRKDVLDIEGCCYFNDRLFYEVQSDIFNGFELSEGIWRSKSSGIDFNRRIFWNYCGYDTEFLDNTEFDPDDNDMSDDNKAETVISSEGMHKLVSMQFSRKIGNYRLNTVVLVKDYARFEMRKLIKRVDQVVRKLAYLKDFFFHTVYFSHFGIVDYSKFEGLKKSFNLDKGVITNVRKCLVTRLPLKLYDYDYSVSHKKKFYGEAHFRDTMLLDTPKSLRKMGEEMGFKKYDIGDSIKDMEKFLKDSPDDFYNYAVRDSEIVLELAENYYADELFKANFPITVSSVGAKYAKDVIKKHFGMNDDEFEWNFKGKFKVKMYNKTERFYNSNVEHYITTMSRYYGGGRNETFMHGVFRGAFIDVDGTSFYPSSASMIPFIDLENVPFTQFYGIVNDRMFDFKKVEVGMCQVNFKYPENTLLPGIPVFTPKNGLIYPLSGQGVWCSVQEIKSAYKNGAVIEVLTGFIFKEHSNLDNPFEVVYDEMLKARDEAQRVFGKGSPQDKKQKLINNSIYGKTGQGIKGKKGYNFISDRSEEIVESSISSGVYANSITAIARATISELMLLFSRYSDKFSIANVVTDGFLLEADRLYSDDELNRIMYESYDNGQYPNLYLFVKQLEKKAGGKKVRVLAQKHSGDVALLIKTRGAVVFNENSESSEGVQVSLTGFKFSKAMSMESDLVKARFLLDLYRSRTERVVIETPKLMSAKDYRRGNAEISKVIYKKFSFNYDYKRQGVDEEDFEGTIRFRTRPWLTVEDFFRNKEIMESNRDIQIKSKEDIVKISYIEFLKKNFNMKINKKYTAKQVFDKFLFALGKSGKIVFNGEQVKTYSDLMKIYEFNNVEPSFSSDFYRKQKISESFHFGIDKNLEQARKILEGTINGSFKLLSRKDLEK